MILRLKLWIIGLAAILGAFVIAYKKGRVDEDQLHEYEDAEAYRATRKRIDEATRFDGDSTNALEFLRDRQNK